MTRTHLIRLARQRLYGNAYASGLAIELTTAAAVDGARRRYALRVQSLAIRARACFYLFGAGIIVLLVASSVLVADGFATSEPTVNPVWCANAIAAALLLMLAVAFAGVHAAAARDSASSKLQLLTPVAGMAEHAAAREVLDAGVPEVLAWRDLVIEERGALCVFDLSLLQDIHHAAWAARDAARTQVSHETTCQLPLGMALNAPMPAAA